MSAKDFYPYTGFIGSGSIQAGAASRASTLEEQRAIVGDLAQTPTPQQDAGHAVLEAATEWQANLGPSPILSPIEADLSRAVCAYLSATRPPAGKRPEEVEPGTRFRLAKACSENDLVYRMVLDGPDRRIVREDTWQLGFCLRESDRIIPLDD